LDETVALLPSLTCSGGSGPASEPTISWKNVPYLRASLPSPINRRDMCTDSALYMRDAITYLPILGEIAHTGGPDKKS
jgi:hypothetical protein